MPNLKTIQQEIRDRLGEVDGLLAALRTESEQLTKMLETADAQPRARAPRRRRASRGKPPAVGRETPDAGQPTADAPASRRGPRRGSGKRVQQTLARIAAQPGITAAELAHGMGIKTSYLYKVLPGLEKDGRITKQGKGYHPPGGDTPPPSP